MENTAAVQAPAPVLGPQDDGSYVTPYMSVVLARAGIAGLFGEALAASLRKSKCFASSGAIDHPARTLYVLSADELVSWNAKFAPSVFYVIKCVDLEQGTVLVLREDGEDLAVPRKETVYDIIDEAEGGQVYTLLYWALYPAMIPTDDGAIASLVSAFSRAIRLETGLQRSAESAVRWKEGEYGAYFNNLKILQSVRTNHLAEMVARVDGALSFAANLPYESLGRLFSDEEIMERRASIDFRAL